MQAADTSLTAVQPPDGRDSSLNREPNDRAQNRLRDWFWVAGAFLIVAGLALVWRFTPWGEFIRPTSLLGWIRSLAHDGPFGLIIIGLLISLGNTLLIPINVLLFAVAVALPGWKGFFCGMIGAVVAALVQASIGRRWGAEWARKKFGERFEIIASEVGAKGFTSVLVLCLLPVAPNIVMNVVVGVCEVPKWKLTLGIMVGYLPGLIVLNLLGRQMRSFIHDPGFAAAVSVAGIIGFVILSQVILRRYQTRIKEKLAKRALDKRRARTTH